MPMPPVAKRAIAAMAIRPAVTMRTPKERAQIQPGPALRRCIPEPMATRSAAVLRALDRRERPILEEGSYVERVAERLRLTNTGPIPGTDSCVRTGPERSDALAH
jgi:hypothetical protein